LSLQIPKTRKTWTQRKERTEKSAEDVHVRILFVADGRSPIAANWIQHFSGRGFEVHLASTFACEPGLNLASLTFIPVAFSAARKARGEVAGRKAGRNLLWGASALRARTQLRQFLGPVTFPRASVRLRSLIAEIKPDLVHAMRIPYEGMLASLALKTRSKVSGRGGGLPPLLVSVWGNDFTLHAPANPWMAYFTRRALSRADGLHTDCRRDLRIAKEWGFGPGKPAIVLPGGGGVQLDVFYPPVRKEEEVSPRGRGMTVINPRGFRAYVRNDTFFKAMPLVLAKRPETHFACPGMAGDPQALGWVRNFGLENEVDLLPTLPREQLAVMFRQAAVTVSPTVHDGTPNTLLEAMACGCFPIAGDLESLREWISPGINGLLVDPGNPEELAGAILAALEQPSLRAQAAEKNLKLIRERAEHDKVMCLAENFYRELVLKY
jgi:glycosyltransferase involved in cell wall biosynthesis